MPEKAHIRFDDQIENVSQDTKSYVSQKPDSQVLKRNRDGSPKSPTPKHAITGPTDVIISDAVDIREVDGAKQTEDVKKTKDDTATKIERQKNGSKMINVSVGPKSFYGIATVSTDGSTLSKSPTGTPNPISKFEKISKTKTDFQQSSIASIIGDTSPTHTPLISPKNGSINKTLASGTIRRLGKEAIANPSRKSSTDSGHSTQSRGSPRLEKVNRLHISRRKSLVDKDRQKLPIWNHRADIRWGLRKADVLLLVGETGSGKSTQVPQFLLDEPWFGRKTVKIQDANGHLREVDVGGRIAITEPRRVAAMRLAYRVAEETGSYIGENHSLTIDTDKVGYSVRFDTFMPPKASIKYVTEGTLLQELLVDPHLRKYSAIIIDEIHERSVDVDLVAGFVKNIVTGNLSGRGGVPLKVVVMSATANMEGLRDFFAGDSTEAGANGRLESRLNGVRQHDLHSNGRPVSPTIKDTEKMPRKRSKNTRRLSDASFSSWEGITSEEECVNSQSANDHSNCSRNHESSSRFSSPVQIGTKDVAIHHITGNQYDVQILYAPIPIPDYVEAMLKTIFQIHTTEPLPGDILAFLTGQDEIESLLERVDHLAGKLNRDMPRLEVLPFYGQLSMDEQQRAFKRPQKPRTRRVVLATNIAETSVTVPGVRYVIDCGKAKVKKYRSRLGLSSLLRTPISQSSAIQRKGRAGREAKGKCYRLYTESEYLQLAKADSPEILRNNVADAVFKMKTRGVDNVLTFPLMDRPDTLAMQLALMDLHAIGALADDGSLTKDGKLMAKFPLPASYSRVLVSAAEPAFDCLLEAIDTVAGLYAEEEIFIQPKTEEKREEIDESRRDLLRREGDIITFLTTMQKYVGESGDRSQWCHNRMINADNMKRALQVRQQLRRMCIRSGILTTERVHNTQPFVPITAERAEVLLKCFLKGFAMKTAVLHADGSYQTTQGKHTVVIHPSSVMHGQKKEAIMFLEHVYTQKNYAKKVSSIQMHWIVEALDFENEETKRR